MIAWVPKNLKYTDKLLELISGFSKVTTKSMCKKMKLFFYIPVTTRTFQSQRNAMPKNVQTTAQLHSSHTLIK